MLSELMSKCLYNKVGLGFLCFGKKVIESLNIKIIKWECNNSLVVILF